MCYTGHTFRLLRAKNWMSDNLIIPTLTANVTYCNFGHGAVYFSKYVPTFRSKAWVPSTEKRAFYLPVPEDVGSMRVRNISTYLPKKMAPHPRKQYCL